MQIVYTGWIIVVFINTVYTGNILLKHSMYKNKCCQISIIKANL